jgi:hypothetical protein
MSLELIAFIIIVIFIGFIISYSCYRKYYVYVYYKLRPEDISATEDTLTIDKLGQSVTFSSKEVRKVYIKEDEDGYWTVTIYVSIFN